MNLQIKINEYNEQSKSKKTDDVSAIMETAAQELIDNKVGANAPKIGDHLPVFTLKNALNKPVNVQDYLDKGPLVITFYRGAWCPYCNLELQAYQDVLPEIQQLGGNLIAISPEQPDVSLSLEEKLNLKFEILSDDDNKIAKELGLVFTMNEALLNLYNHWGIDLEANQGNANGQLPVPATFVVDKSGLVLLSYVNTNYTERLEPSEVLKVLGK